ncbi:putative Zn(II)-responsive transcriptional regulator [Vibrio nigripulchritudo MADA3029]|uniref:Zn(II)-responsive transcriptional regulator n=2 Tax=Vibrio nigripulchritudo TaxID=28173 RepID=A0AAV2VZJ6_9VIBR|nr:MULTISPECIES: Zn(2+)-responsive transcriptional regulator [Vibrio]EGU59642.1 zinc-responsive transcriptional regulator [Vibrio nigripulchritudo ATCC 27043]KJY77296.1 zinc-responsive transcriptional regulator [Vibrio nigripulchritudo]UAB70156.1 Zn(2+)-responsive transcriptional regulator [Vibrio sp. SCSIO 43132]CCN35936.1 putative Zn(II)-responsive transcriptional regulator [Vibrio nigripulchritudo AM115]CCN42842.1 putative Zn(II)-responsive transcriptional regulator [Vibrio nigripulchritudo
MFQIGELAKRCGVSTDTLRFYEKNQLIAPAGRSESGYRLYDDKNQQQVLFILKSKSLGLSLDEIKELLEIKLEATEHSCAEVKSITTAKLELIDEKIHELTRIRSALEKINDACCGEVDDDASHCSILEALAGEEVHGGEKCCEDR